MMSRKKEAVLVDSFLFLHYDTEGYFYVYI